MDGHGNLMASRPSTLFSMSSFPFSSITAGCTPGNGNDACAGFNLVTLAIGEIIKPPFSVCHHVSTIGHFPLPMYLSYQCQASSLIGSPTLPITCSEERSYFSTKSSEAACKERMAVGAV